MSARRLSAQELADIRLRGLSRNVAELADERVALLLHIEALEAEALDDRHDCSHRVDGEATACAPGCQCWCNGCFTERICQERIAAIADRDRLLEALDLAEELTRKEPESHGGWASWCTWCQSEESKDGEHFVHKDTCKWLALRRFLDGRRTPESPPEGKP